MTFLRFFDFGTRILGDFQGGCKKQPLFWNYFRVLVGIMVQGCFEMEGVDTKINAKTFCFFSSVQGCFEMEGVDTWYLDLK